MHTCLNIKDDLSIIDVNGRPHPLARSVDRITPLLNKGCYVIIIPRNHISVMLGLGWSFFLAGWVLNLAYYYKLHPNMVDFDTSRRLGRVYTGPRGWCVLNMSEYIIVSLLQSQRKRRTNHNLWRWRSSLNQNETSLGYHTPLLHHILLVLVDV